MKAVSTIFFTLMWSLNSYAETRATLVLRAYVPPSIRTRIEQTQVNSRTSLVTFSSQVNAKYQREAQKFEVEGLDQSGLEGKLSAVTGKDRTIQYQLLVKHLQETMPVHKPIFLKISAN